MAKRRKKTRTATGRHTIELVTDCTGDDCYEGHVVPGDDFDDEAEYPKCATCAGVGSLSSRYLFRIPTQPDYWEIQGRLPIDVKLVHEIEQAKTAGADPVEALQSVDFEKKARAALQTIRFCDALLVHCSIRPKLVADSPAELPADTVSVKELSHLHRLTLAEELLNLSGFKPLSDGSLKNDLATAGGSG